MEFHPIEGIPMSISKHPSAKMMSLFIALLMSTLLIHSVIPPSIDKVIRYDEISATDLQEDVGGSCGIGFTRFLTASANDEYTVEMEEDEKTRQIDLDTIFSDPDPSADPDYTVLSTQGTWEKTYSDPIITAVITKLSQDGPDVIRITPKKDMHGTSFVTINATYEGNPPGYDEINMVVEVSNINDIPRILRVGTKQVNQGTTSLDFDVDQDDNLVLDILAEDPDESDTLYYEWDLDDVMADPVKGVNYDINHTTGEMWIKPGDGDVPEILLAVSVRDGRGGKDKVDLVVNVIDKNDAPIMTLPSLRTTIEGEYLYITPSVFDPDLDNPGSNEQLVFNYDIGILSVRSPPGAIEFDPLSGRLVIKAIDERMNGEWEVNITVSDLELGSDWGVCRIVIENLNDAPVPDKIYPEVEDRNLTVRFTTGEASDEDGDELTYIWEFGDGSDPVQGVDKRIVSHTYHGEGSYTATLVVTDGETASPEESYFLTVTGPDPDPDRDDDDMEDAWEIRYGFDPDDPSDAQMDHDEDGLTNLEEYSFYNDLGWNLNPRNPDSDDDGWKDGEEVKSSYDPMDPGNHPEGKYEGLPQMLNILAFLIMFLALVFALLFFVMKRRNKPKAYATAAAPVDQSGYQMMQPAPQQYQAIPPARMDALPPAVQSDSVGNHDAQYYDQSPVYGSPEPSFDDGQAQQTSLEWQPPPSLNETDQSSGISDSMQYTPPAENPIPEATPGTPVFAAPAPVMDSEMDINSNSVEQQNQSPQHPEFAQDPSTGESSGEGEVPEENQKKGLSNIPPPPDIPDDL
jgi:hypothetical protein